MKASTTAIIIIVPVIIVFAIALYIVNTFYTVQTENTYCTNWYNSIEERRISLEAQIIEHNNAGFWDRMQSDADYLNSQAAALDAEGQEYNRECAY